NKRLLLVPILDSTDKILALIIQKSYNLTIFQVKDIKEAYNIARSTVMLDSNIELGKEKVPSFANASLKHIYSPYFLKVVEKMLSEAEDVAVEVGAKQIRAKDNIISRLEIAKVANATGNYYTAANTVFLLMMDSNLLDYSDSNFIAHIEKVRSCIEEFKLNDVSNSSLSNFELAGAANLRYLWAKKKFPTDINAGTLSGKLNIYKDVLLSEGWCQAAIDMSSYEHTNGIINMTKANELANRLLQIASSHAAVTSEDGNADAKWHLEVAKEAYSNEMYVEAIIDANFALAYEKIYDLGNKSLNEAGKEIIQILEENRVKNYTFLWPQLYQNHARTFEESDSVSAARLYLFADGLEQSFSEIFNASVTYKQNQTPEIGINQKEFVNISNTQNQTNLTDTQTKIARTSSEQKLSEGWNFRYLLYILIIIAIGYIVQYERKKLQDKKKMQ
ncbi:MAG: hypothetical protein QW112_01745, partial [Candidatus Micrarchaeia archaeon]